MQHKPHLSVITRLRILFVDKAKCTLSFRLFGFLPLLLFGARYFELASQGTTAHILWICHMSSLVIALGFFLCRIELIRISVLWLIIGIPLWPIEIIRTGIIEITSIGTHYIGLLVGLVIILRQKDMGNYSWVLALVWFLFLQQVTRLYTPPELNINLAHSLYPGWDRFFSNYWSYWLFIIGCSAISLWTLSKILSWLLKAKN